MSQKKEPSPYDTSFFQGMYDHKELIGWIEREQYSPAECVALFPLCIRAENCEAAFRMIADRLGAKYLRLLQKHVALINNYDVLEAEKDFPQHRHYLLNGAVDLAYIEGVNVTRDYIARHGSLEEFHDRRHGSDN